MRNIRLVAAIVAALVASLTLTTAPANATGIVKCDTLPSGAQDNDDVALHTAALDPIVFHNVNPDDPTQAQPHSHDFFGNRMVTQPTNFNSKTWSDLRGFAGGSGYDATSCRVDTDTASYWVPTLKYISGPKQGQRVTVRQFSAYYRGFAAQAQHGGSEAIPAGARLVADTMDGHGVSGWTCRVAGQGAVMPAQKRIPDCSGSPGAVLTVSVNFPTCWNGVKPGHPGDRNRLDAPNTEYGDTRDNASTPGGYTSSDFVYPTSNTECPTSHPRQLVQLRQTIAYNYVGNGTDLALSSDDHGPDPDPEEVDGQTFHADFWNTWNQTAFVNFVQRCIQNTPAADCT